MACMMHHARGQGRRLEHDKVRSALNSRLEFGEKRVDDDVDILSLIDELSSRPEKPVIEA